MGVADRSIEVCGTRQRPQCGVGVWVRWASPTGPLEVREGEGGRPAVWRRCVGAFGASPGWVGTRLGWLAGCTARCRAAPSRCEEVVR